MIDIYDATNEDIAEIRALIASTHSEKQARLLNRLYSEDALKQMLKSNNRYLIIAVVDDVIVGVCQYGIPIMDDCDCEDLRSLHAIFIHPDADYNGIASALIYDVEETINEDAGVQRLSLFVPADDITRIKFFAGLGFVHDQVEDTDTEWYMEKDL